MKNQQKEMLFYIKHGIVLGMKTCESRRAAVCGSALDQRYVLFIWIERNKFCSSLKIWILIMLLDT